MFTKWTPDAPPECAEHGPLAERPLPRLPAAILMLTHLRDVHGQDTGEALTVMQRQENITAEAMALPADVRAAAEAIEASRTFRLHFTAAMPLRLHPAAVEFARLAVQAIETVPDLEG